MVIMRLAISAILILFCGAGCVKHHKITLNKECIKGNCTNGQGIKISPDGARYEGEFRDGKLHGVGVRTVNGIIYEGQFRENLFVLDEGRVIFSDINEEDKLMKPEPWPKRKIYKPKLEFSPVIKFSFP